MFLNRLYFKKTNGYLVAQSYRKGDVLEIPTVEDDFAHLAPLMGLTLNDVYMINLSEGEYEQDLREAESIRLNLDTMSVEFSYKDPNAPDPEHPVFEKSLSEKVKELQDENTLLKAQNAALSDRADFIEDVIAEMAQQVYR
ncbi:hypothetical protein [Paenibacillus chibensis]|uniref:hypothetical protein n=1 Tax=Paenibacillus chibensis TaxID=59846 RepID=UPI000FDA2544|nr:hypothetical protein [Paenibacillus chibensis]MEC0370898.1 hypothetical protein [Paenibacillus chibensis]